MCQMLPLLFSAYIFCTTTHTNTHTHTHKQTHTHSHTNHFICVLDINVTKDKIDANIQTAVYRSIESHSMWVTMMCLSLCRHLGPIVGVCGIESNLYKQVKCSPQWRLLAQEPSITSSHEKYRQHVCIIGPPSTRCYCHIKQFRCTALRDLL